MRYRVFPLLGASITCAILSMAIPKALAAPQSSTAQPVAQPFDLSGVWFTQGAVRANFTFKNVSPLLPWAQDRMQANHQQPSPLLRCLPPGVPRIWTMPAPFEIVSAPGMILIYYEFGHYVREIHTTRDHPKDLLSTWMGDSVGKWEGDTLVVDTIGFNDQTWIDNTGLPHSDQLHLVERLRRVNHDVLQLDITVDDPKTYSSLGQRSASMT